MNELNFETGVLTFSVNGNAEIHFNPTDPQFVGNLYKTFQELKNQEETYRAELEKVQGSDKIFDFCMQKDKEMRDAIDACFDEPVCSKVFGHLNVYAFAGGFPIWANFVLALFDIIDKYGDAEEKAMNEKVKYYMNKYKK